MTFKLNDAVRIRMDADFSDALHHEYFNDIRDTQIVGVVVEHQEGNSRGLKYKVAFVGRAEWYTEAELETVPVVNLTPEGDLPDDWVPSDSLTTEDLIAATRYPLDPCAMQKVTLDRLRKERKQNTKALSAVIEALEATNDMLDKYAQKVFVIGQGHQHWDGVQMRLDANRTLLTELYALRGEQG